MKTYTKTDLVQIIVTLIHQKYSNPAILYNDLKTNFNRKSKAISKKDLTKEECESKGLAMAANFSKTLNNIPLSYIESKLSDEITNLGKQGFDINEHQDYFLKAAKERVNEYINREYKLSKKRNK